jgi:hypothetical protein
MMLRGEEKEERARVDGRSWWLDWGELEKRELETARIQNVADMLG